MFNTPENKAREAIDHLLKSAGWIIQNRNEIHLGAGQGIAVREFKLKTGDADYLLYVNRQAVGAIEAKKTGVPLSGVESQTKKYSSGLPNNLPAPYRPLPFLYESTGIETFFTNLLDPSPRSRRIFAFHTPATIAEWIDTKHNTLRARFHLYPELGRGNLWDAQFRAVQNLEQSLVDDRPRALIQMATGAGKTYAAVNYIYRMLKHGDVGRVLFLVDRTNLAKQALKEFQQFETPDDGRRFTELYNVQRLTSNKLDDVSKVIITTIQRLYSILRNEGDFDPQLEEESLYDNDELTTGDPRIVTYNPNIPIEYFDVIVVDECHRSIYNLWRQVLEYFDAYIVGMTATPSKQTFGFFNQNLVMEYTRADAVIDGVNVDSRLYVIRTKITQVGGLIEADGDTHVPRRDRRTREIRMELLDEDFEYTGQNLDNNVVAPDQIRTIIQNFRDQMLATMFPNREDVPKTLVFAKDDNHAEDIVRIIREEFGRGNDFCKKITYRVTGVKPDDLITEFRNSYFPRIAVTVDMIATGTDVKPLEILLFMRQVKSPQLFEQMQGRGTRVVDPNDLKVVTPDAETKEYFVIVDAVGVMETPKAETPTLERKPSAPFKSLLEGIAQGQMDDDTFITLAGRLSRLDKKLKPSDRQSVVDASGGRSLTDLAHILHNATDPDVAITLASTSYNVDQPTSDQLNTAEIKLKQDVADLLTPALRKLLIDIQSRDDIVIDELSKDEVLQAGFVAMDNETAQQTVQTFRQFIEQNRDEITALQILYNIPYRDQQLQWQHIKELKEELEKPPLRLSPEKLWGAYARLEGNRVRMTETRRHLTDLIALVRHALQPDSDLIPYPEQVQRRYKEWIAKEETAGRKFSDDQRSWLDDIANYIGINLTLTVTDFNRVFYQRGGGMAALQAFGDANTLHQIVDELNTVLAAA